MKRLDYFLQRWRIRVAARVLPAPGSLIDIGAHNGEMFDHLGGRLTSGFGVEPLLEAPIQREKYCLQPGYFPAVRPPSGGWDAITMLAVLEHIPTRQQESLANACWELLRPDGLLVITVPSPLVDHILLGLRTLRLIDGMSLEEHFGFQPGDTGRIFSEPRFRLIRQKKFQLCLNHLFVFKKIAS